MTDIQNGIFDIQASQLNFKKTKDKLSEHQKKYMIFNNNGRPKIYLNSVFLPFGVEYYNKKQILNIELYPTKNNAHNNMYSLLRSLEEELSTKNINNYELKNNIQNLEYHSFLKQNSNSDIHIRAYMSVNPEIYTFVGKFKENVMQSNLKGSRCNIELELGTLWINETNFGIIFYAKSIQIL